jgi:hypothetical protein
MLKTKSAGMLSAGHAILICNLAVVYRHVQVHLLQNQDQIERKIVSPPETAAV